MMQESPPHSIIEAARRVWRGMAHGASTPSEMSAVADRTQAELRRNLQRWIGAEGYRALLDRAVRLTIDDHPVLGELARPEGNPPVAASRLEAYGAEAIAEAIAEGMVALVATVTQVLGRIIGEEMAVQLLEQLDPVHLKVLADAGHDHGVPVE